MSAGDLLWEILNAIRKVLSGAMGWLLIAPFARIVPKRRDWVAVIGRDDGKFVDNAKYFLLQGAPLLMPGVRVVFVTERNDASRLLKGTDYEVVNFPSWRGVCFLFRAGTLVVDSGEWVWKFRRFLLAGSKKMQLWHGVGYKRIELDKWRHESQGIGIFTLPGIPSLRRIMNVLNGRLVRFDAVVTTSEFYAEKVFKPALLSRHFLVTGYPRNAFGLYEDRRSLAWWNVDRSVAARVSSWIGEGRRMVLVAPTYKDSRASQMGLDRDTISVLDEFCEKNKVEFLFKFHPLEHGEGEVQGEHLHLCDPDSDVYPLMPPSSALITDYSSIYMDYLLLDKPVLFLVPDLEEYVLKDRQFQFNFDEMTPGPKLKTWDAVLAALLGQWNQDEYAGERARLRRLAFDDLPQDQAVPKLIEFMQSRGWILGEPSVHG